jgi:two-component system, NarL family, response regulator DesR
VDGRRRGGFLGKHGPVEVPADSVRRVVAGATVIDPELARLARRNGWL